MSQAASPPPRRLRPRKWRCRVLLALLVFVFLCAGGIVFYLWFSSHELNTLLAEMDRQDPGWRLEEIEAKRATVPEDRNSALRIMAVRKLLGGQSVYSHDPEEDNLLRDVPPHVQLNEMQVAFLDKRFAALRNAVVEARKLKDMPEGRYPLKYSADYDSTKFCWEETREVCNLLEWDAARRAHFFDSDGALESCSALQNAARSMGDEPVLISQLVRYGCNAYALAALERTLAQGHFTKASDPSLTCLQTALAREAQEATFLIGLRGERAGRHRAVQAFLDGKSNATSIGDPLGERLPGYLTHQHAALLRCLNDLVEAAKLPAEEREERFQILEKKIEGESMLVRHSVPNTKKIRELEQRTQANLRCASTALAMERFRLARNRWPESFDELVKASFLDAVPADPYDGKPIRLKRTIDGLIVYSVGPDKTDNDAFIDRDRPSDAGTDQGFRLWDVGQRRQPPTRR